MLLLGKVGSLGNKPIIRFVACPFLQGRIASMFPRCSFCLFRR